MRPKFLKVGLRKREVSIDLKLRWDKSPWTCEQILKRLPIEEQAWHAQWANNEIYTLVQSDSADFREEWQCMYPAPGDLMLVPIKGGFGPLPGTANLDSSKDHLDIAFFYERGSNLYGPEGPSSGNIFATVCDMLQLETMAKACSDMWFTGAVGERLYFEIQ